MVDTFPIVVQQPLCSFHKRNLYNPKYKNTIYKVQLGCDFLGRIIVFSGMHLGVEYDGHLWEKTMKEHPLKPWELLLGDGHYSSCSQFITPVKETHWHTKEEIDHNIQTAHYRARIEHVNHLFKAHGVFRTPFRGQADTLQAIVKITAHTTAVRSYRYISHLGTGNTILKEKKVKERNIEEIQ